MVEEVGRRMHDAIDTAAQLAIARDELRAEARLEPSLSEAVRRITREQLSAHREAVELMGLLYDWIDLAEQVAREACAEPAPDPAPVGRIRVASLE
jgi:hypothetical protein